MKTLIGFIVATITVFYIDSTLHASSCEELFAEKGISLELMIRCAE